MTRLGMSLKVQLQNVLYGGFIVANFENLHPDFCLTLEELIFLMANFTLSFRNLHAKICEEYDIKDAVVCRLESLKDLPNNCEMLVGNLNVGSGDEEHVSKLQESPVIKFVSNPRLRLTSFLSIKNIITRGSRDAILQDNHPDIFKTKSGKQVKCAVTEWIGMSDDTYPVDLNFIGGDCDGFFLENNKYLNDTSIINNLSTTNYEDFNDCDFEIINNPPLDFWDACNYNSLQNLINLTTFGNLYNCESQPIVQILFNKNLTNPKIGDGFFHNIFTRSFDQRDAIIQDNHPNIFSNNNGTCNLFGIIPNERIMYRRSLNYTGGDCGQRVEIKFCTANLEIFAIMVWFCGLGFIQDI
ncbi:Protein CBG01217 [Caenorhabditis briggsae]|uniref:Protein CBG01217 n=1 Tax=Caenorhabditis briggsae TaxID=6238 RepID=A8WPV3_CAEBR|nr:Protein CBG01217 [Caenorhabditis briggsae]CAP22511.1 Protein CBG01217 [Caenorhabditis briggsae]